MSDFQNPFAQYAFKCGMAKNNTPPLRNSPQATLFLRKIKCGMRRDFQGVKSMATRDDGKIVVEFWDGGFTVLPKLNGKNRWIVIEFEKYIKREMRKRKMADVLKMVSWRLEGDSVVFEYNNGEIERQSVRSYSGPSIKIKAPSLTKFEEKKEAYKKKTPDNTWNPPRSEYKLLQEEHAHDPWRVVIICMLLNRTSGEQVKGVITAFLDLCPNAEACVQVPAGAIKEKITTLGIQNIRAVGLKKFSSQYLKDDWTHITELHGIGRYAADAYAIFCTGRWKDVIPMDHKLIPYWSFLHTKCN